MARSTFTTEDLTAGRVVGLLTIDYAGREWRWSTRPVEIAAADGTTRWFPGGLGEVEIDEEIDLFGDGPAINSIPCEVFWPEDVARLVALGHDLGAATGEFALWMDGDPWGARVVLLDGRLVEPEYGAIGEAVTFSLERDDGEDKGTVPAPAAAVKRGVTWSDSPSESEGASYPEVFGQPGPFVTADGTADNASATPAYLVQETTPSQRYVVIAGHATEAGRLGADVDLYNDNLGDRATFAAFHTRDDQGRFVTAVNAYDVYFRASDPWDESHRVWAIWTEARGMYCANRDEPVSGAGDLIATLLERSTLPIDRGAVASASAYLNRFRVSGYIDDGSSPTEWIKDNLAPILPVSLSTGPKGLYPVVWRYDATQSMAVDELVVGRGLVRTKPIAYAGDAGLVNEITLQYALRARLGEYARARTISGDPARAGEADVFSSVHARQSWARFGTRAETLTTDVLYDTPSVDLALLVAVLRKGFRRRTVELAADQRYDWLRRGEIVLLTDPDVHMKRQLGIVTVLGRGVGARRVEITVLEDTARDARLGQIST